ncbi:LLM class flavin-dependent oxidoreductase [Microbacterium sp. SORGH_AS_0862]|uniref:LLM class flavin-dependent oxidoreductase n=1 Tax=Microbacterium sp. SORGH_AS_0862 TaxID=3041789 RepID=UPI00279281EB|nr:LLM class flavin-dependent oxidoreductase [Microbacterium sp. SORGH_AS_0862]MDQ1205724.1 alkanesulfonate monooxygenase SsuD/methylene tetrahydromethanopterin reductase-like flavin-dependent oxidoreductase (luciferase family) [Microbacterium sp. SORGH_AS_0862]
MSFDLGFLVFLNYDNDDAARGALEDGLDLFVHAEGLGYDSAGVRIHHGVRTLTSPFPFLAAAAERTRRIRLSTGIIPVGWEDPLRFAEDAATVDLLSGGRLDLGLSSGFVAGPPAERARTVEQKLLGILAAVGGDALGDGPPQGRRVPAAAALGEDGVAPLPHGPYASAPGELYAFPRSPGLETRLAYGAGSLSSALRAARLGLNLVLSTIHSEATGPTLGDTQAELIARYREEFERHHPGRSSRVALGRSILPIVDDEDRAVFAGLKEFYDRLVTADGRYTDAADGPGQASPLYAGDPAEIVDRLAADPALALIDELVLTPLTELSVAQKKRVFASVAQHVAPALGWNRAAVTRG